MLFLESNLRQITAALKTGRPLTLISACCWNRSDQENLDNTELVASSGRDAGFNFAAIEGHWTESAAREWWLMMIAERNRASHLLGHARRWTKRLGRDFSIFRRSDSMGRFGAYDSPKGLCTKSVDVGPNGIVFPDGRKFEFEKAYISVGFVTGLAHSKGAAVGVML
jgi:hypothetical protein